MCNDPVAALVTKRVVVQEGRGRIIYLDFVWRVASVRTIRGSWVRGQFAHAEWVRLLVHKCMNVQSLSFLNVTDPARLLWLLRFFACPAGLICLAIFIAAAWEAQGAITVHHQYRMGEDDPDASPGVATATQDGVGSKHLTTSGAPFYSADAGAGAVGGQSSFLSMDFLNGSRSAAGTLLSTVTNNFGLEVWVKPTGSSGNRCIVYNGNTGSSGWGIIQVGNTFQGLFGGVTWFGSSPVNVNSWTHLAIVRNNGTATLYVNGVASGTTTSTPNTPNGAFSVGAAPPSVASEYFHGQIDEVRYFTFTAGEFSTGDLDTGFVYSVTSLGDAGTGSGSAGDLRYCMTQAAAHPGATIRIAVAGTITLQSQLPVIFDALTIDGTAFPNTIISGNGQYRIFFVDAAGQTVNLRNLNLEDGYAKGGDGGPSGGGGLGAGGALFVSSGTVTVLNVDFSDNSAQGGHGGDGGNTTGGGGGGLSGNGGNGSEYNGGGGGGFGGNGGNGAGNIGGGAGGGGGIIGNGGNGGGSYGGGGGGTTHGGTPTPGNGGGGGGQMVQYNIDGAPGSFGGGGGGAGGWEIFNPPPVGGHGGVYGGGGGGATDYGYNGGRAGNGGDFGGGGGAVGRAYMGSGGHGGFGGGGGGTDNGDSDGSGRGGNGGFGAGGGGSAVHASGAGGSYGGNGGLYVNRTASRPHSGGGGGGGALGGAIFVRNDNGAAMVFFSGTETTSSAVAGEAGEQPPGDEYYSPVYATDGQAHGQAAFLPVGPTVFHGGTFSNQISGLAGAILHKQGTGTLTLSAANNFNGGVMLDGGILSINAISALGSGPLSFDGGTLRTTANLTLAGSITLDEGGGTFETENALTVNAVFTGSGSLQKSGAATMILSGPHQHTGGTVVSEGTLLINNSTGSATGSGAVGIVSGATLAGNASISGNTSVSGTLSPGVNAAGRMDFAGNVTLGSGSTTFMEIGGTAHGTAAGYDVIEVAGRLTFGGTLEVVFINGYTPAPASFYLFGMNDAVGTFTAFDLPALSEGLQWNTSALYTAGRLSIVDVINNNPPTLSVILPTSVDEDSGTAEIELKDITAGGVDNQFLSVTAVSSNSSLITDVTVDYTSPDTTGTLSFTPVANAHGTTTITVTVMDDNTVDGTALSRSQTFSVTVNPVNDMPVFAKGNNVSIALLHPDVLWTFANWATGITDGDAVETQSLTFNTSNNNAALFAIAPAVGSTGTLTFMTNGITGTAMVNVSLTDDETAGGAALTTAVQTFTITVTATAPEMAVTDSEGTVIPHGGTFDLGSAPITMDAVYTFNIRNTGDAVLLLNGTSKIAISGAHADDFSVTLEPVSPVPGSGDAVTLTNPGFETPAHGVGGWNYGTSGTGWTVGNRAGVASNGSPWFVNTAPEGLQAIFIQMNEPGSTISQTVNFPSSGNYMIRFSMVRRHESNPANDIEVRMDGIALGTISHTTQPEDIWRTFTVLYHCDTPGNHVLSFVGTRSGGDYASALDDIRIDGASRFEVTFTPAASGGRTAMLSIASNDSNENPYTFTLTGTGILAPEVAVFDGDSTEAGDELLDNADTLSFASTEAGTTAGAQTVTIKNEGTSPLTGLALTLSGAHSSNFITSDPELTTLAPGATTTFTVTFAPMAGGIRNATVNIASNDSDENPFRIHLSGTGLIPEIAVYNGNSTAAPDARTDNTGTHTFASVAVSNSSTAQVFTIRNTGLAILRNLALTVTGTHSSDFSTSDLASSTLAPDATATFTVTFSPTARGARQAVVNIASNDSDENPFEIRVAGTALAPQIVVEQPEHTHIASDGEKDFGNIFVGSSQNLTFTVWNMGDHVLNLTGEPAVLIGGTHAADFTVTEQPSSPVYAVNLVNGGFAAPAQSANGFTYNPSGAGWTFGSASGVARNGSPWFVNSAPEGIQAAFIQRDTIGAIISQSVSFPAPGNYIIRFFMVNRGGEGFANDIMVSMDGVTLATISHTSLPDNVWRIFTVPYTCTTTGSHLLAFNGTRSGGDYTSVIDQVQVLHPTTFEVSFAPSAAGSRTATLSIASNDDERDPYEITLAGTGIVAPEVTVFTGESTDEEDAWNDNTGTHTFPATPAGDTTSQIFTIQNAGNTTLTGLELMITGSHDGDFAAGTLETTTLEPGDTITFSVAFAPTIGGSRNATLNIASNDEDENPFRIQLSGTGQAPEISVYTGDSIDPEDETEHNTGTHTFANTGLGASSSAQVFTIRNTGTHSLQSLSVTVTGTNDDDFIVSAPVATTLAPDTTTTFTVTFSPTARDTREAVINIASNDLDENPFSISVTGTGLAPGIVVGQPLNTAVANGGSRDFGAADVGAEQNMIFTVWNFGQSDLILDEPAISIGGTHAADFTITAQPHSPVSATDVVVLTEGGFETTVQSVNGFTYNPSGSAWTFGSESGVARNGSPWFVNPAPEGIQAAFIQRNTDGAVVSRSLNFPAAGHYIIRFAMVRRGAANPANDIVVSMDSVTLDTISHTSQPDNTWRTFTVPYTCAEAGSHLLAFKGIRAGGDYVSAIDNVEILQATNFEVTFAPSAEGSRTAVLSIGSNDDEQNPFEITITGTGIVAPEITVFAGESTDEEDAWTDNTGTHTFPTTPAGDTTFQIFTIQNTGTTTLTRLELMITGTHDEDFAAGTLETTTLEPGHTIIFSVIFAPTTGGIRSATVNIASNDGDENPFRINVSGIGIAPDLSVFSGDSTDAGDELTDNSETHTFPYIAIGDSSAAHTFTIQNTGTWDLADLVVTMTGTHADDFSISDPATDTLEPDATVTFTVTFAPTAPGPREATISIASNDPDENPFRIHVSGTGTVQIITVEQPSGTLIASGESKDLGSVGVDNTSSFTFTIRNEGNAELILNGSPLVDVSGEHAEEFTVTVQPESPVIGNGDSISITQAGFETPALNAGAFQYAPDGTAWSFGSSTGVAGNGSPWFVNAAPEGVQAAFIQRDFLGVSAATLARTLHFPETANYVIRFSMVRRGGGYEATTVDVRMDGTTLETIPHTALEDDVWRSFTVPYTCTIAGDHTLAFVGTRAGSDYATAIDNVEILSSTTFDVTFAPTEAGVRTAQLSIANNSVNADPYIITLTATGFYAPDMEVFDGESTAAEEQRINGSDPYSFAATIFGDTSAAQTFTIRNAGLADLTDLEITVVGAHPEDFNTGAPGATSVAPDGTTSFSVAFTPTQRGTRTATVRISSNDPNDNPFDIPVSGLSLAAELVVEETGGNVMANGSSMDFGDVNIRSDATATFNIHNPGDAELILSGSSLVNITGTHAADFTVTVQPDSTVTNGTTPFEVRFVPGATGLRTATLSIESNDPDNLTYSIVLSGTGIAAPLLKVHAGADPSPENELSDTSETLVFDPVVAGSSGVPQVFTIFNAGDVDLTDLAVTIVSGNTADFSVSQPEETVVAFNTLTTFTITFMPTVGGVRNAVIAIASNDAEKNPFEINVSGTGLIPDIVVFRGDSTEAEDELHHNLGNHTFAATAIGDGSSRTFTIQNTGEANLTGLTITSGGTHGSEFTAGPPGSIALAPDESTTFSVTFSPEAKGLLAATLSIGSNDPDENPFTINVHGTAIAPAIAVRNSNGELIDDDGSQDFGSINVGRTSASHTFSLQNTGNGDLLLSGTPPVVISGENAEDFIVTVQPAAALDAEGITLANSGFETPLLEPGHEIGQPADAEWIFSTLTGISQNGSEFYFLRPAPEGNQAAFIGWSGSILRDIDFPAAGNYIIRFSVARGFFPPNNIVVRMDGVVTLATIPSSSLPDENWRVFNASYHCTEPGIHRLFFSSPHSGVRMAFGLDDVHIVAPALFEVAFTPSATGVRTATLSIASNDPDISSYEITLTGTGIMVPEIEVFAGDSTNVEDELASNMGMQAFGTTAVGNSLMQTFTIRNTGIADLTNLELSTTGAVAESFIPGELETQTLAPGATTTFTVTFSPADTGAYSASVNIASNDADENPFVVHVTGTGTITGMVVEQPSGTIITSGSSLDLGTVIMGSSSDLTFTIWNTGESDLVLNGTPPVAITGTHAADFTVTQEPVSPVSSADATSMSNSGFEDPDYSEGGWNYAATAAGWTIGSSAGAGQNGSPWFVNPAPEGVQAAFIQINTADAVISRTVSFPSTGNYIIRFFAVRRGGGNEANDIEVRMDGTALGTISHARQADDVWRAFSIPYTCTVAGEHTLSIVGMRGDGDVASAIDDIRILKATTFGVSFSPGGYGTRTATLSIASNDANSPYAITLTGMGNRAPIAGDVAMERAAGTSARMLATAVLQSAIDPDGDALTLHQVATTSVHDAQIFLNGGWVLYLAPGGFNDSDSFTYTVRDSHGAQATGTVYVSIRDEDIGPAMNILEFATVPESGGHVRLRFVGVPGRTYRIQVADNLNGPWSTIDTREADMSGLYEYIDEEAASHGTRFYRAIW